MRWSVVPDLTLYDYWFSGNGWKVRTLFRHLGLPFSIRWVLRGEQHEPWFLSKNPVGQIPVVEHRSGRLYVHVAQEGGFSLAECPAITTWLKRIAAEPGVLPLKTNPEESSPANTPL